MTGVSQHSCSPLGWGTCEECGEVKIRRNSRHSSHLSQGKGQSHVSSPERQGKATSLASLARSQDAAPRHPEVFKVWGSPVVERVIHLPGAANNDTEARS
jgi:hypothetical protein